MAITWNVTRANVNVPAKRADITFTRTDSEKPDHVWSKTYHQAIIGTSAERTALLNSAWAAWQAYASEQEAINAFLDNLEQLAKTNLEAREV